MASTPKVELNGDSNAWEPDIESAIKIALLQNGAYKRIQATFKQRLDEAGWSQDLREYVTQLLRSGQATTYDDVQKIIWANIDAGPAGANGAGNDGVAVPNLMIPDGPAHDAAAVVKKELAAVSVVKKK